MWEPHVSYSTEVLKVTRLLEPLNPYYIYSGYYYTRQEIEDNAPDVVQLVTDAFIEAVLWAKANPDKARRRLARRSPRTAASARTLIPRMSERYLFWPKPTVYYPFDDANGLWPKEESRISEWAYSRPARRRTR